MVKNDDTYYMKKALQLAKKGEGKVSPNPLVGAVVVKNNEIVGRGYHKKAGTPHAEVHALEQAGEMSAGATLYVNLEPCCHIGKTPACSLKIINSNIKRLVVAMEDPNPLVAGKGFKQLKESGIEVKSGVLKKEAKKLNEIFIKNMKEKSPFIYLKTAQTLDGYLATSTGDARWVTNKKAREYGHKLRHKVDGILVGIGTVLSDNPRLTTRIEGKEGIDPIRIVLDSNLRTPLDANIINQQSDSKTMIFTSQDHDKNKLKEFKKKDNVQVIILSKDNNGRLDLHAMVKILFDMEVMSILIEGGGTINHSFLKQELVDKVYTFIAPKILGGDDGIPAFKGSGIKKMKDIYKLKNIEYEHLNDNLLIKGEIN